MSEQYKEINITCPICNNEKTIKVPEKIFSQKKFGIIKIQVPQGGVCPDHNFIVFVDTKGIVRGYEKIDLLMKKTTEEPEPTEFSLKNFINLFGLYGFFSLIHAKVFNYPSYIIKYEDQKDITKELNTIADSILPEKYKGTNEIVFLEPVDYDKIKLKDKNAFLMDAHQNILKTPWKSKLTFEEQIVKKALNIMNENEQLILIRENIATFIKEAEFTKDLLENVNEIYEDELISKLSNEFMTSNIDRYRILLIKEFIKQRFSPKLANKIKSKVEEFFSLL